MKRFPAFLFLIFISLILSTNFVAAQKAPLLKSLKDASLPQLIKEKRNIRFVTIKAAQGTEVKWYEAPAEPTTSRTSMPFVAGAANFHLVKDINQQTDASPANNDFIFNNPYAVLNGILYFSASDGIHGNELWRSDGTAVGTYLVKDVIPGSASSNPHEIVVAGKKVYFVTQNNALFSYELWVSDGTDAGTQLLTTFSRQGPGVNTAYYLTAVGNSVFFFAYGSFSETVLWKTNGTTSGTVIVKDFTDSYEGVLEHTAANGLIYFTLYSNTTGRELYRSDGTETGSFLVKDISSVNDYFNGPEQLTAFNGKLYFSADDGSGRKLWFTNGTEAGTQPVSNSNGVTIPDDGSYIFTNQPFAVQDGSLYVKGYTPAAGQELYRYRPATGFSLVKDITPGSAGGFPYNITPAFSGIAFAYNDTLSKQNELWVTNSAGKTGLIKAYPQNSDGSFDQLTPGNGLLYFVSRNKATGAELWKTNGTAAGTVLVKDIYVGTTSSNPQDLTYANGSLYFTAASRTAGSELWQSKGDNGSTVQVTEINTTSTSYSGPNFYNGIAYSVSGTGPVSAPAGNILYFSATQPETGFEPYKTNGKAAGTALISDIQPGEAGSYPRSFLSKNGFAYCMADRSDSSGYSSFNIYKGDSAGTLSTVATSFNNYILSYDVADNGWVYYIDFNPTTAKYELRRNDDNDGAGILLADNVAATNYTYTVRTVGNTAFFTASDESGTELWKTNGSVAGTKRVKDINAGSNGSFPYTLIAAGNQIFFGADDGSGFALWRSNGTAAGTVKVKAIQPYGIYSNSYDAANYFCVVNNTLYLSAYTTETGYELWKTDGTSSGTKLVKDLTGDATDGNPAFPTNVNGTLFFGQDYSNLLWKSDGTSAGTTAITSIPTNDYRLFTSRCAADDKFFFNANQLLWVSDGTAGGTHTVNDNGLNGVSLVNNLAAAGNTVFFNGYTDKYSYELYAGDAAKVMPSFAANNGLIAKKPASFRATVLQNPVVSTLKMSVQSDKDQTISLSITNANGNITTQQKTSLYKGNNMLAIDAGNWQPGVYLIRLSNGNGERVSISVFK